MSYLRVGHHVGGANHIGPSYLTSTSQFSKVTARWEEQVQWTFSMQSASTQHCYHSIVGESHKEMAHLNSSV